VSGNRMKQPLRRNRGSNEQRSIIRLLLQIDERLVRGEGAVAALSAARRRWWDHVQCPSRRDGWDRIQCARNLDPRRRHFEGSPRRSRRREYEDPWPSVGARQKNRPNPSRSQGRIWRQVAGGACPYWTAQSPMVPSSSHSWSRGRSAAARSAILNWRSTLSATRWCPSHRAIRIGPTPL